MALFVMLAACHRDGVLAVDWQGIMGAQDFLRRTTSTADRLVFHGLGGIDIRGQYLLFSDFFGANLTGANLSRARARREDFDGAIGANLEGVRFIETPPEPA